MMKTTASSLLLPLLVLNLLGQEGYTMFSIVGAGNIIVVSGSSDIQRAINSSTEGTTIFIKVGTYHGPIYINKSVNIVGEDANSTIIESGQHNHTIIVTSSNVLIANLTIRNRANYTRSYGILLQKVYNVTVFHNVIEKHFVGVKLEYSCGNAVSENVVRYNRYGVFLQWSSNNSIYANNIYNNSWNGIELNYGECNVVSRNFICNNTAYGLEIPIYAPSAYNRIFNNNFLMNGRLTGLRNAYGPANNLWDNGFEGNFWDDYSGVDLNFDGIGDTPYMIAENSLDNNPLMGMFYRFKIDWDSEFYEIWLISNSTILDVYVGIGSANSMAEQFFIKLSVKDPVSAMRFCRVAIPRSLINGPYIVLLDQAEVPVHELSYSNDMWAYIYFSYRNLIQKQELIIVPEFSSTVILLSLAMILIFRLMMRRLKG